MDPSKHCCQVHLEDDTIAGLVRRFLRRRRNRPHGLPAILRQFIENSIIYDMRIALDTDVVVAAMRSPTGASAALLRAAREGHVTLVLTVALAMEYESVCSRAEHRLASGLPDMEIDVFLTALIALAEPVETHFLWRPQLRDPGDEMVLEAAVNGRANALVTFNVRHFGAVPSYFGIEVLHPLGAIGRIRK